MSWFVVPNTNTLAWLKIQDHWVGHHHDLSPVTFMWRLPKIGLPPVIIYRWIFPKKNHPAIGVSMGIPHLWKPLPETSSENQWLTVDKIRWFLGSQPISSGQTKEFLSASVTTCWTSWCIWCLWCHGQSWYQKQVHLGGSMMLCKYIWGVP